MFPGLAESRILLTAPVDTRPRTSLISFCTVQLRTLCAAHSLATLCLFMTSGPDPGELPGFWGSMVFRHAPIPRKGSGKQQQQQQENDSRRPYVANLWTNAFKFSPTEQSDAFFALSVKQRNLF